MRPYYSEMWRMMCNVSDIEFGVRLCPQNCILGLRLFSVSDGMLSIHTF